MSNELEVKKTDLIVSMINKRQDKNNTCDLDEYGRGLSDMYDHLNKSSIIDGIISESDKPHKIFGMKKEHKIQQLKKDMLTDDKRTAVVCDLCGKTLEWCESDKWFYCQDECDV